MPDYEIRIRLTDVTPSYAHSVAWTVGKTLDTYPHLDIRLAPPRQIEPGDACECNCRQEAGGG